MEHKPMNVVLSPHGEQLLRAVRALNPEMSPAEILGHALEVRFGCELESPPPLRTPAQIRAWLDELAALSDAIPPMPGETFSREMIDRDHG
jgi:hypothetical protein